MDDILNWVFNVVIWVFLCLDIMYGILEYLFVKRVNVLEDSLGFFLFKIVWKIIWGSCVMLVMNFFNKNNRVLRVFWIFLFNLLKFDCFWIKLMFFDVVVLFV